jgi:hypothetical protein
MRERGRGPRAEDVRIVLGRGARPRPNRLSDEATPNVLTGMAKAPRSNTVPSWVGASAARRAVASRPRSSAAGPGGPGRTEAQTSPNWFTLVIIGFILLSLLRACLQLG